MLSPAREREARLDLRNSLERQAEPKARDWLTALDDFRSWLIRELCKQAVFPTDSSQLRHRGQKIGTFSA
jgi:hypothetical protein